MEGQGSLDNLVPDIVSSDRDLRLWLVSKLDGTWSSSKISTLTKDVLHGTLQIFGTLETSLKLKLLFACVMAKNDVPAQDELHSLFETAKNDESEWVRVVASLLSTHESGSLNFDYLYENPTSKQVIEHLKASGLYTSLLPLTHRLCSQGFTSFLCSRMSVPQPSCSGTSRYQTTCLSTATLFRKEERFSTKYGLANTTTT